MRNVGVLLLLPWLPKGGLLPLGDEKAKEEEEDDEEVGVTWGTIVPDVIVVVISCPRCPLGSVSPS